MIAIPRRRLPLLIACLALAVARGAGAAQSWDGTWAGGWEHGDGVQIIIAGDKVIGVGRGMEYPDLLGSQVSADGGMLSVAWVGGDGMLRRIGERDAAFTLREHGRPERSFAIHRELAASRRTAATSKIGLAFSWAGDVCSRRSAIRRKPRGELGYVAQFALVFGELALLRQRLDFGPAIAPIILGSSAARDRSFRTRPDKRGATGMLFIMRPHKPDCRYI